MIHPANVHKQHLKPSILIQESRSPKTFRDHLVGKRVQSPGNEEPVPVPQVSVCAFVCVCFCLFFQFSFLTFYIRNLMKQDFKLEQGLKLFFVCLQDRDNERWQGICFSDLLSDLVGMYLFLFVYPCCRIIPDSTLSLPFTHLFIHTHTHRLSKPGGLQWRNKQPEQGDFRHAHTHKYTKENSNRCLFSA